MIDCDHNKTRGTKYCPLMKEDCTNGTTPSMGGKECASWQSLVMKKKDSELAVEVFACSVYEWPPQQWMEISMFVRQGTISSDKVATEVREQRLALAHVANGLQKAASIAVLTKQIREGEQSNDAGKKTD